MQDKVGSIIPSAKDVDDLVAEVKAIETKVAAFTILLSKEDRAATLKFRRGGEEIVGTIATLANEHGVTLPKISTEAMKADLLLVQRLRPLSEAIASLAQRLDDTTLEAQSECWWAATAFYTALSRLVNIDPKIQLSLKPIVHFFALGRRKKPEPEPRKEASDKDASPTPARPTPSKR